MIAWTFAVASPLLRPIRGVVDAVVAVHDNGTLLAEGVLPQSVCELVGRRGQRGRTDESPLFGPASDLALRVPGGTADTSEPHLPVIDGMKSRERLDKRGGDRRERRRCQPVHIGTYVQRVPRNQVCHQKWDTKDRLVLAQRNRVRDWHVGRQGRA